MVNNEFQERVCTMDVVLNGHSISAEREFMDILLNGLSISAEGELIVAVLHDGKYDVTSMSLFGC